MSNNITAQRPSGKLLIWNLSLKKSKFEIFIFLLFFGLAGLLLLTQLSLLLNASRRNVVNLAGVRMMMCLHLNQDNCSAESKDVLEQSDFVGVNNSIAPKLAQVVLGLDPTPFPHPDSWDSDHRIQVSSFLSLADLFVKRGDKAAQEKAILAYLRFEEQPRGIAYYELGELYFWQKRYSETISVVETALLIDQNSHEFASWRLGLLYFYLADAYRYQGQFEQALRYYPLVIQNFPEKGWPVYQAAVNTADIYLQQENTGQAFSYYQQAESLAIKPAEQANVFLKLARYYIHIVDYQQASVQLEKAAAVQANNLDILVIVAQAFEEIDNIQRAIQTYRRLLQIDPEMIYAQKNLERLTK